MKKKPFLSLTVILPIINEEKSLIETVEILNKENLSNISQFIFVCHQNKTSSKSVEICNQYVKSDKNKYMLLFQKSPNLGGAIRDSFDIIETSHCLMMSADLETNPHSVKEMVEKIMISPQCIITATRWKKKDLFDEYGFIKKYLNYFFQIFFSFLYQTSLSDLTFGFRIFPTDLIKNINWEMHDHSFLLETILKPIKMKVQIIEVTSSWKKRSEGYSSNELTNYFKYFYIAFKILFYKDKNAK